MKIFLCWARYKNLLRVEGWCYIVLCCESYSPLVECLHVGNIIERPELHPRTVPWPDLRLPSHQSAFRSPPCRLSSPPSGHSRRSDRRLGRRRLLLLMLVKEGGLLIKCVV